MAHQCGGNGRGLGGFLVVYFLSSALFVLGPLMVGEWFVPIYTCAGREGGSLVTHFSINASMFFMERPDRLKGGEIVLSVLAG